TMDTWLIWKLTQGKTHAVSYSNASSSGCIRLKDGCWHQEFLEYLGVPLSVFPEIKSESANYGMAEVFEVFIPINGAIADQQSALFAQGCLEPGSMKCTNGTGSFMDINIGTECTVASGGVDNLIAWQLQDTITYMVEGFVSVTGSAVQWLRDGLKMIEKSADIEALAASVPDTNGVYFVPALVGLTTPHNDPFARGMMIGMTRGTTNAHIARATLECIAFGIKDILDVVEKECHVKIEAIKVDGGASENDLLVQMLADYCDAEVVRPDTLEATSLGAALMASLYTDDITLEAVKTVLNTKHVFRPQMDKAIRDERCNTWKAAVERALNWMK
ncbi:MAG: FGGY-family carbohydrate kinase, partial [Eubacterium sp.]